MRFVLLVLGIFVCLSGCGQKKQGWYLANKRQVDSLNNLKVGINDQPTKYKKGFKFLDSNGVYFELLKYVPCSTDIFGVVIYRWRVKMSTGITSAHGWTDDVWIDIYTGKAHLDSAKRNVIYYDSLKK